MIGSTVLTSCATNVDCHDTAAVTFDASWLVATLLVLGAVIVVAAVVLARRGSKG
ncbi:hypothetical protein PX701_08375 [Agromyces sp. H3Y2-19a]|uniref:hypothetical protein n=1 Tax=Agromyces TaxID=33877 RepID=UPI001E2B8DCC|nr:MULTISPECIES: hypothetical protein [Agromyces]MCD5345205.1 hypothetical protein [Agromyces sp. S2-1-8]MDF0513636.1 hypothetical protein [Agromyces chromiiresistens]